jgi:hypothetical protein
MTYNPCKDAATYEHFARWEFHSKTLDMYSLKYIINDCKSAAENMKNWNPIREGFYLDQAATYGMEVTRRNAKLPYGLRHRV